MELLYGLIHVGFLLAALRQFEGVLCNGAECVHLGPFCMVLFIELNVSSELDSAWFEGGTES